jgi:hypothetical protein
MKKESSTLVCIVAIFLLTIAATPVYGQKNEGGPRTGFVLVSGVNFGRGVSGDICFEIERLYNEAVHIGAGVGGGYNAMAAYGGTMKGFHMPLYAYAGYSFPLNSGLAAIIRLDCGYVFRQDSYESSLFLNPQIGLLFNSKERSAKPFLLIGYRKDGYSGFTLDGYNGLSLKFGFRF